MQLSDYVNTFGQDLLRRYGERIHKLTIHAGFTCPNRDGSKDRGGCTFCNNDSFSPNARDHSAVHAQLAKGREVVLKRTRARRYIGYFQAYTNTYADVQYLAQLYEEALRAPHIVGLSVGTRPDCVPHAVLELLASYQQRGFEVWLELGLQSAFDETLNRVKRGHGFAEYAAAVRAARAYGLPVCAHLIVGLPGEGRAHALESLAKVLALGVDGLKIHPLHVVRHTQLALQWRRGESPPLDLDDYIATACDLIERTPPEVVFHRVTGTAGADILLAPDWCDQKWLVINRITQEFHRRGSRQGSHCQIPYQPLHPLPVAQAA